MSKHPKEYRWPDRRRGKRPQFWIGLLSASILVLTILADKTAWTGPWTQPKGRLYVNYSVISTNRKKIKAFDGTSMYVGKIRTLSHTTLVKYGVLEDFDIHVEIPYELSSLEGDPAATIRNFGDGRFGFQYRLLRENRDAPLSLALGFEYKRPLSSYRVDKLSSPGEQQEDYEYRFLLGRFFDIFEKQSYFSIEGGYRTRTSAPPDEVFGYGELGMRFVPKVAGRVFVYGVDALGGIGLVNDPQFVEIETREGAPPFPFVGENYVKVGLGLTVYPTDSVDVGVFYSIPTYRSNTSLDRHIGISIGYNF